MNISLPKLVALDSATLGKICKDFWSGNPTKHAKAKRLIGELTDRSIYIVISYTHLCELIRHDDEVVANDRIRWLGLLPMVAWIRSHDGNWWVGGMLDVVLRELSAIVQHGAENWAEVIGYVKPLLLETGVGGDMFVDRPELWSMIRSKARQTLEKQIYIASLARVDTGEIYSRKFKEFDQKGEMPGAKFNEDLRQATAIAAEIEGKLSKHGDERLPPQMAATAFVSDLWRDIADIKRIQGNPYRAVLEHFGIPIELVTPNTTIGEIGELGIYAKQLSFISKILDPTITVTLAEVPPASLPSFEIDRALMREQHRAPRVSGSDLGDCHVLALALYLDAVEVDKRTFDHVRKIYGRHKLIREYLKNVFRCSDYGEIVNELEKLGIT